MAQLCSMMSRSVLETIISRSPAARVRRSAGRVSGNGCQLRIERTTASASSAVYGQPSSAQKRSRVSARISLYGL